MVPTEVQGALAAAGSALVWTCSLTLGKLMQQWQWPYFFLLGVASLTVSVGLCLIMFARDTYHLDGRDVKWVLLRGLAASASYMLPMCAVLAGAHMGSVGALSSVNTIVAALLGHFVLGEDFSRLHLLALLLAMGGVILIWDPDTMGTSDPKVLGNALALLGGFSSGCTTIVTRKAGKASSLMLTMASTSMRCPLCLLLAFWPNVPDGRFLWLEVLPAKTALYCSVLLVLMSMGSTLLSAGSKKCPAAVSATLITGTQMALGYVVDVLCFHKSPKLVEMAGAYMMLLAVLTMAFTNLPRKAEPATLPTVPQPSHQEGMLVVPARTPSASSAAAVISLSPCVSEIV